MVRTLLLWTALFVAMYAGLRAADAPVGLFIWLFSWVAAVWCATMLCSERVARGVSAAISVVFGGIVVGAGGDDDDESRPVGP